MLGTYKYSGTLILGIERLIHGSACLHQWIKSNCPFGPGGRIHRPLDPIGELRRTYAIIFLSAKSRKKRRESYEKLLGPLVPKFDRMLGGYSSDEKKLIAKYESPETMCHLGLADNIPAFKGQYNTVLDAVLAKQPLHYANYPFLEDRLRKLRSHMDLLQTHRLPTAVAR